jgi:OmcA/MtrC family decaheme c-type cytochrome
MSEYASRPGRGKLGSIARVDRAHRAPLLRERRRRGLAARAQEGSMRLGSTLPLAAGLCLAVVLACKQDPPRVGGPLGTAPPPEGYRVTIMSASLNGSATGPRQVYVNFSLAKDGSPVIGGAAVAGLLPSWTIAALGVEPVTGVRAWASLLLVGAQTNSSLPVAGPGSDGTCTAGATCPGVLVNVQQPGADTGGQLLDHGNGTYTYIFENTVAAADPGTTLRVGVFLAGVAGTSRTSTTFDFLPNGTAVDPSTSRELVLESRCDACHGAVKAHDGHRVGAKLCVTCHTFQNADPDTIDPAAMAGSGATPATNPNPLDLGRLVHRIHRGRNLPTLYQASSGDLAVPLDPLPAAIAAPFFPGRNTPLLGQKFAVIGALGREHVFGRVATRDDNGQPGRTLALGIAFPREYRGCEACHGGAKDEAAVTTELSRRSCQGCHPDVWFGAGTTDAVHLAHPGGPQSDDSRCADCHLRPGNPTPYAPIDEIHVAPGKSGHTDPPVAEIVSVQDLAPGKQPVVCFRIKDRLGLVSPLNTTAVAPDVADRPIPRGLNFLGLTVSGPAAGYVYGPALAGVAPANELPPLTLADDPAMRTVCPAGTLEYRFNARIPDGATGTWGVGIEARRGGYPLHPIEPTTTTPRMLPMPLVWPYTGESVYESADNPLLFLDLAGGTAVPPRDVVDIDACNRCHDYVQFHGTTRHQVRYCAMCHTADRTDWAKRPKHPAGTPLAGDVNLATVYAWTPPFTTTSYGTNDDVEERSIEFKVMIHRIHTGGRSGPAQLETVRPFLGYVGGGGSTGGRFYDEVQFPGDLADCTRCHLPGTYRVEAVPANALPTIANETATIQHAQTANHGPNEPRVPPIQSACLGCHATEFVRFHAALYTVSGKEQCGSCHGASGTFGVAKAHGVWEPPRP